MLFCFCVFQSFGVSIASFGEEGVCVCGGGGGGGRGGWS